MVSARGQAAGEKKPNNSGRYVSVGKNDNEIKQYSPQIKQLQNKYEALALF